MARPYVDLKRETWASLAEQTDIDLDEATLARLRGIGDPTSTTDVAEIYRPLTQLIHLYRANTGRLYEQVNGFFGLHEARTPFFIGVAGSVAVGKSTVSRLLQELLRRSPDRPQVDLITTDGFLYPNEELQARGLLDRKGFPESYNRRLLLDFAADVKSGTPTKAPVYSHQIYDIVPGEFITVDSPDIVIIEGLNVLQPPRPESDGRAGLSISDFFDFSVFVDAEEEHIKNWFISRFATLRQTAFQEEDSFFKHFTQMSEEEALGMAGMVWDTINGPNLRQNIIPTRERATAILHKGPDHSVEMISVRKI